MRLVRLWRKPVETKSLKIPKGLAQQLNKAFAGMREARVVYGRTWKRSYGIMPNYCYIAEAVGKLGKRTVYRMVAFHGKTFELLTGINASTAKEKNSKKTTIHFLEGQERFGVPKKYRGRGFGSSVVAHSVHFLARHGLSGNILMVANPDVRELLTSLGMKETKQHRFVFKPEAVVSKNVDKLLLANQRVATHKVQ